MDRERTESSGPNRRFQIASFFNRVKANNVENNAEKSQKWNFNFFTGQPLRRNPSNAPETSPALSPVRSQGSHEEKLMDKGVATPEFDRHSNRQDAKPVPDSLRVNLFFEEAKSL